MKAFYLLAFALLCHYSQAQCTVSLSNTQNATFGENYVNFTITSSGGMSDIYIDLGNGDTIFESEIWGNDPNYYAQTNFMSPGVFQPMVYFTDTNNNVCTDTSLIDIVCTASFDYTFDINNNLQFTNTSQSLSGPLSYFWRVNPLQNYSGDTSSVTSPTFNLPFPESYFIRLEARTNTNRLCGVDDSISVNSCNLNFIVRNDTAFPYVNSLSTRFDSINWDFGDGNSSSSFYEWFGYGGIIESRTKHNYAQDSTYELKVTAIDEFGNTCRDTIQLTYAECFAGFTKHLGAASNSVLLANTSSSSPGTNYRYNFGDGTGWTNSTSLNISHNYANYGTYYVCVSLTNYTNGQKCNARFCDSVGFDSTGTLKSNGFTLSFRDTIIVTGIEDFQNGDMETFRMFPNPMHDDLYLDLRELNGNSPIGRIRIYNSSGSLLTEKQVTADVVNQIELPDDLSEGMYILELEYEGKTVRKKLIKH